MTKDFQIKAFIRCYFGSEKVISLPAYFIQESTQKN